ncbi:MAG: hypothetical protein IKB10_01375 [Alphaproteobacteria bacterium]|nr:hypothetical protein [Alphaproteobacteria bacterium]
MKRFLTCFCAIVCIAPSVCIADAAFSRVIPTTNNVHTTADLGRVTTSRVATRATESVGGQNNSDAVRSTVSRVFTGNKESQVAPVSRPGVVARATSDAVARSNLQETVNTVGRNTRVSNASINANPAVRRAGLVLRPSTAEVGGRATIDEYGTQTGSNINDEIRSITSRAAKEVTAESIAAATEKLEQTAALNKSCQEQYNECMDQFCAVVDANQKRCSCSANLSKYAKVEQAVKDANNQLNEVAQRIRYVGLSADEIRAIMTQTEAEAELAGASDTSETRSMLEEIEALIKDPVAATSSYAANTSFGLDMNLDFSSDSADIFNLDFLDTNISSSFSNLRGADLYNAAKSRCSTVLSQCKSAGATTKQVTGNYDLAIDKDCIAYEQGLTKMNETLVSNVRSANLMLQKARLAVLHNKNQYDAKGCIGALETCMKDDMVCGDNYYKCIDPTKKYIDENGEVVLGQDISQITGFMESYNNSDINKDFLNAAMPDDNIAKDDDSGKLVVQYLQSKIGTGQKITDGGLCRAVLDKCQNYTYSNGNYVPNNDIVLNYVQRAMVNIRAAQQKIISEYASGCVLDIADCYNKQYSQINTWSSNASMSSIQSVMRGACRNVALTCAYAVFDDKADEDAGWKCKTDCSNNSADPTCQTCLIDEISEMFYQSLLCPDNSVYNKNCASSEENSNCVNTACSCVEGYEKYGATCRVECGANATRDMTDGTCKCKDGYSMTNGLCVCESGTRPLGGGRCWTEETACLHDPNKANSFTWVEGKCNCKSGYTWSPSAAKCIEDSVCNGSTKESCMSPRLTASDGRVVGPCSWIIDNEKCKVNNRSSFTN